MKYFNSYLQKAVAIITQYNYQMPLVVFTKNYFKQHKQIGSNDRKNINQLLYAYYRLGKAFSTYSIQEKIAVGLMLQEENIDYATACIPANFTHILQLSLPKRVEALQEEINQIFPLIHKISTGINSKNFIENHLHQPQVFIRIRKGFENKVIQQLLDLKITFTEINSNCIAVAATTKLQEVLVVNKEVVIQDYASQQIATFLQKIPTTKNVISVWDCCAASGGKSILAKDVLGKINLTVSDTRPSLINNLKKRLETAAINIQGAYIANAAQPIVFAAKESFDIVLADVPCSGSGTFSRTPEYLQHTTLQQIEAYSLLQKNIVQNVFQYVKKGGYLLYITCSVYKNENEEVIEYLQQKNYPFKIIHQQLIVGYTIQADTMFACLLQKI